MLFKYANAKLEFLEKIDKSVKKEADGFSAMRKFKDMDKYNDFNSSGNNAETMLDTVHQNTITELRVYSAKKTGVAEQISTISLDGKMVIWNLDVSLIILCFCWMMQSIIQPIWTSNSIVCFFSSHFQNLSKKFSGLNIS